MRIGYLISRYPAVSHTFILREVLGLRRLGWTVETISIRPALQADLFTETDRAEARATHVIITRNPLRLLAALFMPMLRSPDRWCGALAAAWRLRRPGLRGFFWAMFYFMEALLVHRHCRRSGLTHLHAHFANVAGDVAMLASILNGGAFSFTMHGPTEFFDQAEHRLAQKAAAAKCIVCISDFCRSQMMALLPPEQWHKLHVVHCGVDPAQMAVRKEKTEGPTEILCVARLAPVKGHAIVLKAVADLLIRGHWLKLTLIGDGPMRHSLEQQADVLGIADQVTFLGSVGQDVIAEHYARADIFVLPSFAEGVPVVLMEALAARCPVIATRIAGIAELVEPGVTGTLVPPGRADLLAAAMEVYLQNPHLAERLAQAGCEKVRRDFNVQKTVPQLAAILEQHLFDRPVKRVLLDARHRGVEPATAEAARRPALNGEAALAGESRDGRGGDAA